MQIIKSAMMLFGIATVATSCIWAQAPGTIPTVSASGVTISLALGAQVTGADHTVKVVVSVGNATDKVLVHRFVMQEDSVHAEIHDATGAVPSETDLGCKKHMSTKCGPNVKLGTAVNFTAMVVLPGHTATFDYDLSREYKLENSRPWMVDIAGWNFVLVDAPKNVIGAEPELRRLLLMDYENYSYTKLGPIRSNVITIDVRDMSSPPLADDK
jgi:hypothetical protein